MKKLLYLLASVIVAAAVLMIAATFFLGSLVKTGVDRFGPTITKTKVELAEAKISPLTGNGTIKGLLIGNPPGWKSDRAIYLGKAHLSVEPFSLMGDHIVIREILIDQPEFVYETKIISSNLKDLLNNVETATSDGKATTQTVKTKSGKPIKFEVKRFRLQNGKLTLGVGIAAVTVPMPPLTLTDLGTAEGGITANQLSGVIMKRVLSQALMTAAEAVAHVGKSAGSAATDATVNAAKKAAGNIKRLFGGK